MRTGLLVGRFQPFHFGHLDSVKHILTKMDRICIAVGSSQKSHESRNPFTSGERIDMIWNALNSDGIDGKKWMVVPVPDSENHSLWVSSLETLIPRFDLVYSNDHLTITLLEEEGLAVERTPLYNRSIHSGTEVRRRMFSGEDWETIVPQSVVKYIKEIKGVERLVAINDI